MYSGSIFPSKLHKLSCPSSIGYWSSKVQGFLLPSNYWLFGHNDKALLLGSNAAANLSWGQGDWTAKGIRRCLSLSCPPTPSAGMRQPFTLCACSREKHWGAVFALPTWQSVPAKPESKPSQADYYPSASDLPIWFLYITLRCTGIGIHMSTLVEYPTVLRGENTLCTGK